MKIRRARIFRMLRLAAAGFAVLAAAACLWLSHLIRHAPVPPDLATPESATRFVLDRHGDAIASLSERGVRRHFPLPAGAIPPQVRLATLAAEDQRFDRHSGVDLLANLRAIAGNLRRGRTHSGASTITQQLVKLSLPERPRDLACKFDEALIACRIEQLHDKDWILARYLNRIDYGNGNRGIEAAARDYFGKPARLLTPGEAAFLAGLPRAPSRLNPRRHPDRAHHRFHEVARCLRDLGHPDPSLDHPPTLQPPAHHRPAAPHFTAMVRRKAPDSTGDLATTLDAGLQEKVAAILRRHLDRLKADRGHVTHAAAVVIDHRDGSIRAWCGSGDWNEPGGQIDAVTLPRSSGSTLKPFLYLHAIDRRVLTAASVLPDTPDAIRRIYPDYDPRNFDERFWGPVRVRDALGNSLNVPAVVALSKVGPRNFLAYLDQAGLPTPRGIEEYGAGLILGNTEIRLLDLTAAFSAFNGSGIAPAPRAFASDPVRRRALGSSAAATILADILADNDARRRSFGPRSPLAFPDLRIPCKTGTSSGFRDAWTVGLTGRHAVGVWFGNFSGEPMNEIASVTGPAPAWREIMEALLPEDGGLDAPDPDEPPAGLVCTEICPLSGLRPLSPSGQREWFLPGTSPAASASAWFPRGPGHPPALPEEFAVWTTSAHNFLRAGIQTGPSPRIAFPIDGSEFRFDPTLPACRQRIELVATGIDPAHARWSVNGRSVPWPESPSARPSWQLEPGDHELVLATPGTRLSCRIRVIHE